MNKFRGARSARREEEEARWGKKLRGIWSYVLYRPVLLHQGFSQRRGLRCGLEGGTPSSEETIALNKKRCVLGL